jgi:hypothetical protein
VAYASVSDGERAAPLAIRGSKLRLLKPEERAEQRLEHPQTLWDVLCGLIKIYREAVSSPRATISAATTNAIAPRFAYCSRSGPTSATMRRYDARHC